MSGDGKQTPREYLANSNIADRLRRLGITDDQLEAVRFRRDDGDPFDSWRVMSTRPWPIALLHDMRAWCAFRWLILEDPEASRDRDDAWNLVAQYEAEPIYEDGRRVQANRTQGGRKRAESHHKRFAARDRRIHDAAVSGTPYKVIAATEGLKTESAVSRILRKPRP